MIGSPKCRIAVIKRDEILFDKNINYQYFKSRLIFVRLVSILLFLRRIKIAKNKKTKREHQLELIQVEF